MKKVYLLVSGLLLTAGAVNAQQIAVEKHGAELNTEPFVKNGHRTTVNTDREADAIVWENGFEDGTEWTAAGPSGDYELNGWSIGATTLGWYFGDGDDMGTTGDFARFVNGDPGVGGDPAPVEDGPFTLTFNDPIDLSTIPAPHIEFEQYGARFFTVQAVQVSTDGGGSWETVGTNDDIAPLTDIGGSVFEQPESKRYNITSAIAADPSNVMIRLMWDGAMNGPEMNYIEYAWFVDDIRIVEGHSFDLDIQTSYFRGGVGGFYEKGLDYYQIPQSQAAAMEIEFAAETINQGGSTFPGVYLNATVTGPETFTGTSAAFDIAPGDGDSVATTTTFSPATLGNYEVTWEFLGDETDTYNDNDILVDEFEVTEDVYARDNGNETGNISNVIGNEASPLLIGNVMDFFAEAEIGYVDIAVSDAATNVGQLIYAQIMVWDEGSETFVYMDQTADHSITFGENGGFIRLGFDEVIEIDAGQSILVLAGHYGDADEVEFSYAQPTDAATVLLYTSGATEYSTLGSPRAIMVRAITSVEGIGIEDEASNNFSIGQNQPNPFNANSLINYELNEAANVSVEIIDVAGKIVKTINQGTQSAGKYTLNLDANNFAEGVYYYIFTVGNEKVTKSMVITK